jgi:endonuclease/exonuclease/phosphatase (EEP) superfamily protein YafD
MIYNYPMHQPAAGFRFTLRFWGLIGAAGAVAGTATILGFFGGLHWFFDICSHFRVQYGLALGLASLLLLIPRQRKTAAILGFLAAVNLGFVVPLFFSGPDSPASNGAVIRAMLFNVNTHQGNPGRVRQAVLDADPDILVLEEVSRNWLNELAPVFTNYPYSREAPADDNFGIALYSRLPFKSAQVVSIGEADVPSILADVESPAGVFTILATHPLPPAGAEYSRLRNNQLAELARTVRTINTPVLLMGDLNMSPWSPYFNRLVKDSGLRDSARGYGLQPSWPTMNPLLLIPLDHALHSPGIGIVSRRIGPDAGSDHYPLIVEFVLSR